MAIEDNSVARSASPLAQDVARTVDGALAADAAKASGIAEIADAAKLLRLPFSILLAPVWGLAAVQLAWEHPGRAVASFLVLHLLVYPASNAFNSAYDRDEGPINGLRHPPPVNGLVLPLSIGLMALSIALALPLGLPFLAGVVLYTAVSAAYSHPALRIKRRPIPSLAAVALFQGLLVYELAWAGAGESPAGIRQHWPGVCASLFLAGSYPLTQVHQHDEDARRGDLTLSRLLGIRGTFAFSALAFALALAAFVAWTLASGRPMRAVVLAGLVSPAVAFFLAWWRAALGDASAGADFGSATRMSWITAAGMLGFCAYLAVERLAAPLP